MNTTHVRSRFNLSMRTIALVVILAFSICQIPVGAVSASSAEETADQTATPTVEATILAEDVEKREETVKHFRMTDGSIRAVQYALPVHYLAEDEWVDYDNTLTEVASEEVENPDFVNAASDIAVRLSKKSNGKKWVRLEIDGYKLSWYFKNASKVTGLVQLAEDDGDATTLEKVTSAVTYPDIYDGVDLVEHVTPYGVKEDLLLKRVGTRTTFEAVYNIDTLTAVQTDDRTIELRDTDGTVVYTLSAPYMTDADGAVSTALSYRITETGNKTITVELTVDGEWLTEDDRAFPVTVDPSVATGQTDTADTFVETAYVSSAYPTDNFGNLAGYDPEHLRIGRSVALGDMRALLKMTSLPTLRDTDTIVRAQLLMYLQESAGETFITIHRIDGAWSADTVTWNTKPSYHTFSTDSHMYDGFYPSMTAEERTTAWDVTTMVHDWYTGAESNYGVMLVSDVEGMEAETYAAFYSCANTARFARPMVQIDYRDQSGLETYWTYTGVAAGRSGSAQVNLFNGNLVVSQSVVNSADGNRLPVSIGLTYNGSQTGTEAAHSNIGDGWRTNFHQTIEEQETTGDGYIDYILYTDGDGTRHAFPVVSGDIHDEDGLGYTLEVYDTIPVGSAQTRYAITDKDNNTMEFNGRGHLTKITDVFDNAITVSYVNLVHELYYIKTITDGAGRAYTFVYASENGGTEVLGIKDPSNRVTNFTYSNNLLTGITFPDGKQVAMTYDEQDRLSTVSGNDGATVDIEYKTVSDDRVKTLTRRYGTTISERYLMLYFFNETTVSDYQTRLLRYQFDSFGQTTGILSDAADAGRFYEYADRNVSPLSANKITLESRVQTSVTNMVKNQRVDVSDTSFSKTGYESTYTLSYDGTRGNTGNGSLKVSRTAIASGATNPYVYYYQTLTAAKDGYYTLSAFVNTNGATLTGTGAAVRLERWSSAGANLGGTQNTVQSTAADEWKRVSITMEYAAGDQIRVLLGTNGTVCTGTMWFDDIQLEYGATANHLNLLENSTFENGTTAWTIASGATIQTISTTDESFCPDGNMLSVPGLAYTIQRTTQTITVKNGQKGDVYSFGAWSKANSGVTYRTAETDETGTRYGIRLEFLNNNHSVGAQRVAFNPYIRSWQMAGGQAIAPAAYNAVRIVFEYHYNLNTARLAQPYVYRERFGQSYAYDDNGNLIATEDLAEQESTFAYANDDLYRMLNPTGSQYMYSYDFFGVLQNAVTTDGIQYTPTYDEYGNVTQTETRPLTRVTTIETGKIYHLFSANTGRAIHASSDLGYPFPLDYQPSVSIDQGLWQIEQVGSESFRLRELYGDRRYLFVDVTVQNDADQVMMSDSPPDPDADRFAFVLQEDGSFVITSEASNHQKCLTMSRDGNIEIIAHTDLESEPHETQRWFLYEPMSADDIRIVSTATYTEDGNLPKTVTDALGNTTTYEYDATKGLLQYVEDALYNRVMYWYDQNNDRLTSVSTTLADVMYTYDSADRLKKITLTGGQSYELEYDALGRNTAVKITTSAGTSTLSAMEYDRYSRLIKQTYGNGNFVTYTYDELDRTKTKTYNGNSNQTITYYYNADGMLGAVSDQAAGNHTRYVYDLSGRLAEELIYSHAPIITCVLSRAVKYEYTEKTSQLDTVQYNTAIGNLTEQYVYGNMQTGEMPDAVYEVKRNDTTQWEYAYDALGRLTTKTLVLNPDIANAKKTTTYAYKAGGHGAYSTSTQLASETTDGVTTAYTYDAVGNITAIHKNGSLYERYTYDEQGQLATVTTADGVVYTYVYGNNGNLTAVTKRSGSTTTVEKRYVYGNTTWKDQLTKFNNNTITYDTIGNPLTYHDGAVMTWDNGRRLTSYTKGTDAVTFTYDGAGNRLSKTVNGTATTYTYVGGRLYGQQTGNSKILFLYDDTGAMYGFIHNDTVYYYHKNIQGDVLGIYDANGNKIVTYSYDAWGAPTGMTDTSTNSIGTLNPIRYRGYYYDAETGFYYVSSRYYDPEIGRWINADNRISGVGGSILGYNMFAYCMNNPVNMSDPTGSWPKWIETAANWVNNNIKQPVASFIEKSIDYLTPPSKEDHYNRNQNNIQFPEEYDETFFKDWDDSVSANCHQFSAPNRDNVKYVSPDGKYEAIYDVNNKLVTDPRDVGTYNFISPNEDPFGHFIKDVIPWIQHGNSPNDSTEWWQRALSFIAIYV